MYSLLKPSDWWTQMHWEGLSVDAGGWAQPVQPGQKRDVLTHPRLIGMFNCGKLVGFPSEAGSSHEAGSVGDDGALGGGEVRGQGVGRRESSRAQEPPLPFAPLSRAKAPPPKVSR